VFWPLQSLSKGFGSPPGLQLPKGELTWECESSFSHSSWPMPLRPFCLGCEPKARVATKPHFNRRSKRKVVGVPTLGISRLPFGSPKTKCHLDVGLVERYKVYYKGEGGGFPQIWAVVSLTNLRLPVTHPSTKSAPTMHSPTCCLVLCRFVWVIKCLSFFLVPSRSSSTPLYPQNATSQGACPNSLLFHYLRFRLTFESIKELGGVSRIISLLQNVHTHMYT
jgi:hypothetical protein